MHSENMSNMDVTHVMLGERLYLFTLISLISVTGRSHGAPALRLLALRTRFAAGVPLIDDGSLDGAHNLLANRAIATWKEHNQITAPRAPSLKQRLCHLTGKH